MNIPLVKRLAEKVFAAAMKIVVPNVPPSEPLTGRPPIEFNLEPDPCRSPLRHDGKD